MLVSLNGAHLGASHNSCIVTLCTCNSCGKASATIIDVSKLVIAVKDTLEKSDNNKFIVSVIKLVMVAPNLDVL